LVSANTNGAASTAKQPENCRNSARIRAAAAGRGGAIEGLVHDPPDGASAAAALGAAAQAAIDLPSRAWRRFGADRRADVVVAQHIAGTNDHGGIPNRITKYLSGRFPAKEIGCFYSLSKL
jgi:hypothetical protein